MQTKENNKVLLLVAHNDKSLAVRYIANYLSRNGFEPTIIFIKTNIYNPQKITKEEFLLLKELIDKEEYLFIGISILSSFTLLDVKEITNFIKSKYKIPIIWGGAYVTIMPKEAAKHCDYAIKGEGEIPILQVANALKEGKDIRNIPGLCYYNNEGDYLENDIAPLIEDIDTLGSNIKEKCDIYLIESNKVTIGDPQLETEFYEISCSRGCPFNCSYCCSPNIKRLYKNKGKYLRFRSVENIIEELQEAIKKNPKIKEIRFWDEIFSNQNGWVSNFSKEYKKHINLPFTIWGHPLMIKEEIIKLLSEAGLKRIVVGIQSGSPSVRNEVFKRPESNEQIIKASKILSKYKIPEVYYDLMICHPLENMKELKETFDLCLQLEHPFRLEIHGLAFLPGADINEIAIQRGIYTKEEIENMSNSTFQENDKIFRGSTMGYYGIEDKKEVWADLIYLTQYENIRKEILKLAKDPNKYQKLIRKIKHEIETLSMEDQNKYKIKNCLLFNIQRWISSFYQM